MADILRLSADLVSAYRYEWPAEEEVPTFPYSDYFSNLTALTIGDDIVIIGDYEIVTVKVIDKPNGEPIVYEWFRASRTS